MAISNKRGCRHGTKFENATSRAGRSRHLERLNPETTNRSASISGKPCSGIHQRTTYTLPGKVYTPYKDVEHGRSCLCCSPDRIRKPAPNAIPRRVDL